MVRRYDPPFVTTSTPPNALLPSAFARLRAVQSTRRSQSCVLHGPGGSDLTPSYLFPEDAKLFHRLLKVCVFTTHCCCYHPLVLPLLHIPYCLPASAASPRGPSTDVPRCFIHFHLVEAGTVPMTSPSRTCATSTAWTCTTR